LTNILIRGDFVEIIFTDFEYRKPLIPLNKDLVDTIFIHHPAWIKATPEMIHNDVLADPDKANWSGFPYNEYITKDEKVYIGRGDYIGSQAANYNSRSYGICLEGDYNIEPAPSDRLIEIVAIRTVEAQRRFPNAKIVLPHSARYNTDCPGKNFPMGKLYNEINKLNLKQNDHWAEKVYRELTKDFGLTIHEKRFDDNITRGEAMALILQFAKQLR
jgi:hypothetical protein